MLVDLKNMHQYKTQMLRGVLGFEINFLHCFNVSILIFN